MIATREGKSRFTYTNKIADGSPMTLDSTNSSEQPWEQKQFTGYECRLHQYLLYILLLNAIRTQLLTTCVHGKQSWSLQRDKTAGLHCSAHTDTVIAFLHILRIATTTNSTRLATPTFTHTHMHVSAHICTSMSLHTHVCT